MRKRLKKVARLNKVPLGKVRFEIDKAIDHAAVNSLVDENVASKWNALFPDGEAPSAEDFIKRLAEEVLERASAL